MRFLRVLFLLILCISCSSSFSAISVQSLLQHFIDNYRVAHQIPAMSVSIKMGHQPVKTFLSGTALLNGTVALKTDNLFGVGSISKTFVSATILQLAEEKRLNINDCMGRYLPEYPRWKNVTIKKLMNMTSGIPNYTEAKMFNDLVSKYPKKYYDLKTFVQIAYQQSDYFLPRKGWYYANTNYSLLAMIIEKVTHHSLVFEYQHRFFLPLHLYHTFYSNDQYDQNIT